MQNIFNKKNLTFFGAILGAVIISRVVSGGLDGLRPDPTEDQMVAAIMDSPAAATYQAVAEYFPEDAQYWREQMVALEIKRREGTFERNEAVDMGAVIRRKHSGALKFAPDTALREVMEFQHQLHAVYADAPDACGRLLMQGPAGLTKAEQDKLMPVLDGSVVQFKAMYLGETNPTNPVAASDEDWDRFFDAYFSAGYDEEELNLVIEPDPANPKLCNAFLGFFEILRDGEFEGAAAIRSEVVPTLVGS